MVKAQNILVLGATGLIGSWILKVLIREKHNFQRIAIFTSQSTVERKSSFIASLQSEHVDVIVGDVRDSQSVSKAFEVNLFVYLGFDTVISALGRNALLDQITLIDIAEKSASVKWFLPSEYGTDIEYGPKSASEKPHQMKLKVRERLRKINKDDLTFTCVVTGPFADGYMAPLRYGPHGGGFDVTRKKANLLGDGNGKISLTTMFEVLRVNSFTTTPKEVLAEYEKQAGTGPWEVSNTPLEELKKLEEQAWADKSP
ncbi:hypothetical protein KEM56_006957, partial [Ascosphaera pollenicola]